MMRLRRASAIRRILLARLGCDDLRRVRVGVVAAARGNIARRVDVFAGLDLAHCRSYLDRSGVSASVGALRHLARSERRARLLDRDQQRQEGPRPQRLPPGWHGPAWAEGEVNRAYRWIPNGRSRSTWPRTSGRR